MSGLLVKSTVVMRDNLAEMNSRGLAGRWPVLLGGAALTRAYVEQDLAEVYDGEVRYARDAFEGLRLMDAVMAVKPRRPGARCPPGASAGCRQPGRLASPSPPQRARPLRRRRRQPVPTPPFRGDRVVKGIPLADYASLLDERATFLGQWGLQAARGGGGPSYEELVETEGRPRLRMWLDRLQTESLLKAGVVYGYFPAVSKGDDLIVLDEDGSERTRFTFPRQRRDRHLCLADFFRAARPRPARRGRLPAGHRRLADQRGDRGAVRQGRLPGLPGAARPVRAADRGAGRVLARPGPRRARARPATTRPTWTASSRSATAAAATRSATRPARTWRTGPRSSSCSTPERIGVTLSEEFQLVPEQSTDA